MLKHPLFSALLGLATLIPLTGCGSPYAAFGVEYDSVTVTSTQDSAKVTFNVLCEEYAGRNEANVCPEDAGDDNPICYEVYWMPTAYDGERRTPEGSTTNLEQGTVGIESDSIDVSGALMKGKACRSFSQTPQTHTFEVSFDASPPATAIELIIKELPDDGKNRASSYRDYVYPLPQPAQ